MGMLLPTAIVLFCGHHVCCGMPAPSAALAALVRLPRHRGRAPLHETMPRIAHGPSRTRFRMTRVHSTKAHVAVQPSTPTPAASEICHKIFGTTPPMPSPRRRACLTLALLIRRRWSLSGCTTACGRRRTTAGAAPTTSCRATASRRAASGLCAALAAPRRCGSVGMQGFPFTRI